MRRCTFYVPNVPSDSFLITSSCSFRELSLGKIIVEPYKGNLAWGKKKQLERLPSLLAKYIDEIMLWFNNKSGKVLTASHVSV